MHVMIFEPRYKGHHLFYVRLLVTGLLKIGCRISFAGGPDVTASDEYHMQMDRFKNSIGIFDDVPDPRDHPRPLPVYTRQLRRAVKACRPEHLLLPSADGILQQLATEKLFGRTGFLRGCEVEALLLRCRFTQPDLSVMDRIKTGIIRGLLWISPARRLFMIDALGYERLQKRRSPLARRMRLLPDPLEEVAPPGQAEARGLLGIPVDGRYLGIVGVLDVRKGIDKLVAAFRRTDLAETDRILLAGRAEPAIRDFLDRQGGDLLAGGRMVLLDRVLSDAEIVAAIAATDVVCTPYLGHLGPSGIVARAMALQRPVLTSDYGWCGHMVPRLGAGWAVNVSDEAAFSQAIARAFAERHDILETPMLRRFVHFISADNFVRTFLARIRERLGLEPEKLLTWQSVTAADTPPSEASCP